MKTILLTLLFLTTNIYADKNWIPIEPIKEIKTQKPKSSLDMNMSEAKVFKLLVDTIRKKENVRRND
ncbi:hypothetical protein N9A28_03995 [Sulfurimonas sp.]|nr:hypothetical protein [Sulfurimonas sp.]